MRTTTTIRVLDATAAAMSAVVGQMRARSMGRVFARRMLLPLALLLTAAVAFGPQTAVETSAANPAPRETYYVPMPALDLLEMFDEIDEDTGGYPETWPDPVSPIRSIVSISVASTGSYVYYDQWEDGGYDTDIANPTNVYSASNPDGTQIWGDGNLANGCAPSINDTTNPCAAATDDELSRGDVITLDNLVYLYGNDSGTWKNVKDEFGSVSYSNSDGKTTWSTSWDESGDDDQPDNGDIQITGGELQFYLADTNDSIERSIDLSGYTQAYVAFAISASDTIDLDGSDEIALDVFNGSTWTTVHTFNTTSGATQIAGTQYWGTDISQFINSDTRVRIRCVDSIEAGEYYWIDDVEINWAPYARDTAEVMFDGGDKVASTQPVALSMGAVPRAPGSVMAGATEVASYSTWRDLYVVPAGEDTPDTNTSAFEYVITHVMAGSGGATINVDANGDGDLLDADDVSGQSIAEGANYIAHNLLTGAEIEATSGVVQVHMVAADVGDTYEQRWFQLAPREYWSSSYIAPVGTDYGSSGSGCTEVWAYAPSAASETVRDEFDASPADYNNNNGTEDWSGPWIDSEEGYPNGVLRFQGTQGTHPTARRSADLSGASTATLSFDVDTSGNLESDDQITISVDDSSSFGSPTTLVTISGDASLPATYSYSLASGDISSDTTVQFQITNSTTGTDEYWYIDNVDITYSPGSNVRDQFNADPPTYSNNNGGVNWTAGWADSEDSDPDTGLIQVLGPAEPVGLIQVVSEELRFHGVSGPDPTLTRSADLSGATSATLSFDLSTSGDLGSADEFRIRVDSSASFGSPTTLATYVGSPDPSGSYSYSIPSGELASGTTIEFTIPSNTLDTGEYYYVDNVEISYTSAPPLTINVDRPGGSVPDHTFTVANGDNARWPSSATNLRDEGFRLYTSGGEEFLPIQIIDCTSDTSGTDGRLYDWGYPLIPGDRLTTQVLVGWSRGCTGVLDPQCHDPDISNTGSRSVVWVTPLADTTIYIDYDGGGVDCGSSPVGAGAEDTISASELVSYRVVDDPVGLGSNGTGNGENDFDMTGAFIQTCDGTHIAVAYGQDNALSGGNDDEALDLGTVVLPFGSDILIDKSADKTEVREGGLVNYSFDVWTTGTTALTDVSVVDDKCSPATYASGDTDTDDALDPGETWVFTCQARLFQDTTNVAYSRGSTDGGTTYIESSPDEWTVTVVEASVLGNYVWFDENGDGVQDAGEAGIPNVLVTLTGNDEDGNPVSLTTYTDANGGYLFTALAPSDGSGYTVTVTPPTGLHQTYDEDGTGTANSSTTVLGEGVEHLTADFGYNWAPTSDTDNPPLGATGAIGDRVWIDANGDGVQDPGEAGLGGVTVTLYTDDDGDGVFDDVAGTTTTSDDGTYIFDGLDPDAYVVVVTPDPNYLLQTGDPDGTLDNKTTSPIVLGPGDVYLNADFGYQPSTDGTTAGPSSDIGDTIWFDADADGVGPSGAPGETDTAEWGIPGVTVSLILDTDGDGVWDAGEEIIATDITDSSGHYLFPGLPAGDYIVWVNDTQNVLGEVSPTYDPDGGTANQSAVTTDGVTDVLDQDFGYSAQGHSGSDGLIGDTVFLDRDGDGSPDLGEGLEGVKVELYESDGTTLVATTYTDENGNYSFGNLEASTTYVVKVDTTTLPGGGTGLTNTVDPDTASPGDSTSTVDLSVTGPIDLDQDFGYRYLTAPNTISGTIWEDTDTDGTLEGTESDRFEGVTVVLLDTNGNVVATTTTDVNGDFSFTGLPNGTYTVDVTDDDNVLNGHWHSDGPNDGDNNNSQNDPYTVSVSGGATDDTADFGYYIEPGAVGDFVWHDLDGDGIQDAGEPGIEGALVTLTVTYPSGDVVTITTVTDSSGAYSFDNLLLDEDYDGVGTPGVDEPTYVVTVTAPDGYMPTLIDQGADDSVDSDNFVSGSQAYPTQGTSDPTHDFGFVLTRSIGDRVWHDVDRDGVQDGAEPGIRNATVNLYLDDGDGVYEPGTDDTLVATTVTDWYGMYLFDGLAPDHYWVEVDTSTIDASLTETYDEDDGTTSPNSVTAVDLTGALDEHLTADFGYAAPDGEQLIGDRVWYDVDGDGVQDPNEPGIEGVRVFIDTNDNGVWDSGEPFDFTDSSGTYYITGQDAGTYDVTVEPPSGYDATPTNGDASRDIQLPANQDVLYADFGFTNGTVGSIGDFVWNDLNGDGVQDSGEPGIAGVTVSVIRDDNGNGVWDAGEPIIATDTTDADGYYLFDGLPIGDDANDDYLVWVNDTGNVLDGLNPTYDKDGIAPASGEETGYGITAVTDLTGDVTDVDFGYRAPGAFIGNFVFHDLNGDGVAGISVIDGEVDWDNDGVVNGDADDDGEYGGVTIIDGRFDVNDDGSITADDDGYVAGIRVIDGYLDMDGDGTESVPDLDDDGTLAEPGIEGVTVELRRDVDGDGVQDPEDTVVLTTTTDETGHYLFTGLPADDYLVDVDSSSAVLSGFSKTTCGGTGSTCGADNNSQADPYPVTLATDTSYNLTADFGFEASGPTYSITGNVFEDVNNNGGTPATEDYEHGTDALYLSAVVYLYADLDGDGILDPEDPLIATTTTGTPGSGPDYDDYGFHGLPPGDYIVRTDATPMFLEGYVQTTQQFPYGTDPDKHDGYEAVTIGSSDIVDVDFGFHAPGDPETTPVTLSYFATEATADGVRVDWSTETEVGNVGFNLYAKTADGLVRLNDMPVRSHAIDSSERQDYSLTVEGIEAGAFYIQDVDVLGRTSLKGEFTLGQTYGERAELEPIDWPAIQAEHEAKVEIRTASELSLVAAELASDLDGLSAADTGDTLESAAGAAAPDARRGADEPKLPADGSALVELRLDEDGLYRVTYEALRSFGLDLSAVRTRDLALSSQGNPVPLFMQGTGTFGPGEYFEFLGEAVETLYTRENVYTLSVDPDAAKRIAESRRTVVGTIPVARYYMESVEIENDKAYSYSAPNGDPWFDRTMVAFGSRASTYLEVPVTDLVPGAAPSQLRVSVWGNGDWPNTPDHHLQVLWNAAQVADEWFDGVVDHPIEVELPAGAVREGVNELRLDQPFDSGVKWDVVSLESYGLTYPRAFVARDGVLEFTAQAGAFRVSGLPTTDVVVYVASGADVERLKHVYVEASGQGFAATFAGGPDEATYYVYASKALLTPDLTAGRPYTDITSGSAQYLMIAHPDFIPGLAPLAAHHEARGLQVRMVDTRDIYAQYSHGVFDAGAIRDYIAHALTNMGTEAVLLVGGDTYDYMDNLGLGSMSFVPTLYAPTDTLIQFAPVDPLLVDVDGDRVPDAPIGRFPARTAAELDSMIAKTLAYDAKDYGNSAVFAADANSNLVSFTADSDAFIAQLPGEWDVERAYVDDLDVGEARARLIGEINDGVALTSFVGHSSSIGWTFRGLFKASDAEKLTNAGRPTVVTQWGCWNTYHVSPYSNSLAHKFLLSGDNGASAVLGAATLTESTSEHEMGVRVTPRLVQPGVTMGRAIQEAKLDLARTDPGLSDVLLGWTLLGDPMAIVTK